MHGTVFAKTLLNRPERLLYGRLVRAFPGHVVLSQVALSRLLVAGATDRAGDVAAGANRFGQLIADFVICKADFTALAVVELAADTGMAAVAHARNRRKHQYLRAAGVKVICVPGDDLPSEAALKALVAALPLQCAGAPGAAAPGAAAPVATAPGAPYAERRAS